MRFVHIADIHLGARPDSSMAWSKEREKEIWDSLRRIINLCNEQKVDLLLIAGDLFHRQPLVRELKEVKYIFSCLENTQVVLMAGNHDYISPRSHYLNFEWDKHVHMLQSPDIGKIEFPHINTEVYGLSYYEKDIYEAKYDQLRPEQNERLHILLAHGGDDRNIPINRKSLIQSGFDYIALGHIHKPEIIQNKMAYCGSLEPLDKTELGPRGYIYGKILEDRVPKIEFVPFSKREYRQLDIEVNSSTSNGELGDIIRRCLEQQGNEHIYTIRIQGYRDEAISFQLEELYQLGNILEIRDESIPDYDFDLIQQENEGNLIGLFIERLRNHEEQDQIRKKALYYGMEALLGSKE